MMYSSKLVCAVKTGGKILREEQKDGNAVVTLPFGSEYSLILKNLSGRRALVNIEIDGKKLAPRGFVFEKGAEYEIERPTDSNKKFKFIEKTEAISDHRGDRVDDSLIRITWQFERASYTYTYYQTSWPLPPSRRWWRAVEEEVYPWVYYGGVTNDTNGKLQLSSSNNVCCSSTSSGGDATPTISCTNTSTPQTKGETVYGAGITVGGSKSHQRFDTGYIGLLDDETHSMVIQLRGFNSKDKPVEQPVTVQSSRKCPSCGKHWKTKFKFCPNDGTSIN